MKFFDKFKSVKDVSVLPLTVSGVIIEHQKTKSKGIPFATIIYYNFDDSGKVEFQAISNLAGEYRINNMQNGKYKVKITASGFKTKYQDVQFQNVENLAKGNNSTVKSHIVLEREINRQINPVVYQMKELVQNQDNTIEKIIENLQHKKGLSNCNTCHVWFAGSEIEKKYYDEIKDVGIRQLAKAANDETLNNSYIEFYDLSDEKILNIDGVFNVVFNGQNRKPIEAGEIIEETTDFFLRQ